MAALNISLPKSMKDYVEAQVREGGYSTPSEYVRALLREDQKRKARQMLETLLLEGVNSGQPIELTAEYWNRKRQALIRRYRQKSRVGRRRIR